MNKVSIYLVIVALVYSCVGNIRSERNQGGYKEDVEFHPTEKEAVVYSDSVLKVKQKYLDDRYVTLEIDDVIHRFKKSIVEIFYKDELIFELDENSFTQYIDEVDTTKLIFIKTYPQPYVSDSKDILYLEFNYCSPDSDDCYMFDLCVNIQNKEYLINLREW